MNSDYSEKNSPGPFQEENPSFKSGLNQIFPTENKPDSFVGNAEPSSISVSSSANFSEKPQYNFAGLETKMRNYLANVQQESRRIAQEAKQEIQEFKEKIQFELHTQIEELNQYQLELDAEKQELELLHQNLEAEKRKVQEETFEKSREEGRQVGHEEGYRAGLAQGREELAQQIDTEVQKMVSERFNEHSRSLLPVLDKLVNELAGVRQTLLKHWEENILQIAAAIAYQTITRELAKPNQISLDLLREALELAIQCTALKVKMNPNDLKQLHDPVHLLLEETGNLAHTELIPDPKITPGGCLVETSLGTIDQRLESRLERIISELSE